MAQQYSKSAADPKVILDLKVNAKEAIDAIIAAQEQIAKLKEEQRSLEAQMKSGNGSKEAAQGLVLLKTEIKDLNTVVKANEKELDNQVKSYKQNGDSLNAMRAQLKSMRAEFEDLSKADRESEFGEKMLGDIKTLSDQIKSLEQAQGDFTSSVGSYGKLFDTTADQMQSFGSLLGSIFGQNSVIGKAATVVTGFGKTLSDMSKNITDMATSAEGSTKSVTELTTAVTNTTSSVSNMNESMESASTVVQGFGAAERAADDAAKAMVTSEAAAATATSTVATASAAGGTATTALSSGFNVATTAVKAFSKSLLTMLANPYVAAFAAIVVIVMKLVDAFKKNDAAMTALESVMAAFRPILDLINKGFQAIVGVITKVIEGISKAVQAITNAIPFLRKYAQQEEDIVRSTDALEDAERNYALNSAKRQSQISELRNKAAESEKYSFAERKKFLEQAMDLEKQDIAEKKANAEESLRIAEQKALNEIGYTEMTAEAWEMLSDDQKNHITELRVNVESLSGEYAEATRRMTTQLDSFIKEEKNQQKQRAKAAADAAKERKKNEQDALNALEDMYINSIKDMQSKEIAQLKTSNARQIKEIEEKLKTEKNLSVAAKKALNQQIVLLDAQLQEQIADVQIKYSRDRMQKELEQRKTWYQTLLQGLSSEDSKVQVQVELVNIDTQAQKQALSAIVEDYQRAVDQVAADIKKLNKNEIKIKYSEEFAAKGISTAEGYLNALKILHQMKQDELQKQQINAENITLEIERQAEIAKTRITREGLNAREALTRAHADLLNEIETNIGLETFYNNEVEKSKILEQQAQYRLSVAKKNLENLKNYTEQEQIAIFGTVEAYQNALLEAQLDVVKGENAVKEAARNTTASIEQQQQATSDAFKQLAGALGGALQGFEDLFNTLAESDDKYRKYSTALAMMQILISTAVSVATAIEGAVKASKDEGPLAPIMLAVNIAAMVGAVVSGIASATATLKKAQASTPAKPKFASGGLVGPRTTTKTDDKIDAKLSEGEYVIKSAVVKAFGVDFFDALNGTKRRKLELPLKYGQGGIVPSMTTIKDTDNNAAYEQFRLAMVEALAEIHPIVSVREINDMQTRVRVKEETSLR